MFHLSVYILDGLNSLREGEREVGPGESMIQEGREGRKGGRGGREGREEGKEGGREGRG